MKGRIKLGDIIVISVVLIAVLILSIVLFLPGKSRADMLVITNGQTVTEYPLNKDSKFEISGNDYTLIVEIKNGSAFVKKADCPDNTCVHTGKISKNGQMIACVPAGITLGVSGKEEGYDFVAG